MEDKDAQGPSPVSFDLGTTAQLADPQLNERSHIYTTSRSGEQQNMVSPKFEREQ